MGNAPFDDWLLRRSLKHGPNEIQLSSSTKSGPVVSSFSYRRQRTNESSLECDFQLGRPIVVNNTANGFSDIEVAKVQGLERQRRSFVWSFASRNISPVNTSKQMN